MRHRTGQLGFTLAEMAMVIVVMGLIMTTVLPALSTLRSAQQRAATETNLQTLMRATAAYAQAAGCLPCPTPANVTGTKFGRVRGDVAVAACGTCANAEGIVPFVSMGIGEAQAKDGWGRWITMRIDPLLAQNPIAPATTAVAPPTAPCQSGDLGVVPGCTVLNASQKGLCQPGLSNAGRVSVATPGGTAQQAAVIFVSHGINGRGSFVASARFNGRNGTRQSFPSTQPDCSASTGFERCNADTNTAFVNATPVVSGTDPYDDLMIYADRNSFISLLGTGACQTTW